MDLIVKMIFGAHLYGTATDASDMDFRGVFMPSKKAVLLGRIPKCRGFTTGDDLSRNTAEDVDEDVYALHHFIKLACQGQIVAMDMLHAPEALWLEQTPLWRRIVAQRHRFYTKSLKAFSDYAQRQASKYGIKGSRLAAAAQVLKVLKAHTPELRLERIWDRLPRVEHCREAGQDPNGKRLYQVCGKTFQESVTVGYMIPVLEKFYDTYGKRAELAAQNKQIDWKAVSHALRAAIQTREILVHGTIRYPLADAPFLLEVKHGRLDYSREVAPTLEKLVDEVERLLEGSGLPDRADTDYWDDFVCQAVENHHFAKR